MINKQYKFIKHKQLIMWRRYKVVSKSYEYWNCLTFLEGWYAKTKKSAIFQNGWIKLFENSLKMLSSTGIKVTENEIG